MSPTFNVQRSKAAVKYAIARESNFYLEFQVFWRCIGIEDRRFDLMVPPPAFHAAEVL